MTRRSSQLPSGVFWPGRAGVSPRILHVGRQISGVNAVTDESLRDAFERGDFRQPDVEVPVLRVTEVLVEAPAFARHSRFTSKMRAGRPIASAQRVAGDSPCSGNEGVAGGAFDHVESSRVHRTRIEGRPSLRRSDGRASREAIRRRRRETLRALPVRDRSPGCGTPRVPDSSRSGSTPPEGRRSSRRPRRCGPSTRRRRPEARDPQMSDEGRCGCTIRENPLDCVSGSRRSRGASPSFRGRFAIPVSQPEQAPVASWRRKSLKERGAPLLSRAEGRIPPMPEERRPEMEIGAPLPARPLEWLPRTLADRVRGFRTYSGKSPSLSGIPPASVRRDSRHACRGGAV